MEEHAHWARFKQVGKAGEPFMRNGLEEKIGCPAAATLIRESQTVEMAANDGLARDMRSQWAVPASGVAQAL